MTVGIFRGLWFVYLFALSVLDIKTRKIPVRMLQLGSLAVLLLIVAESMLYLPPTELFGRVMTALLGASPGALLTVLSFYTNKIGRGDGPVLILIGLMENCTFSMIVICLACICLTLFSGILICFGKVSGKTQMPYIPFVTISYIVLKLYEGSFFIL